MVGVGLAIDCHWNYGVQAAIGLARALEQYNLLCTNSFDEARPHSVQREPDKRLGYQAI
jgi:hypothetical protein